MRGNGLPCRLRPTGPTGSATGLPAAARVWVRRLYTTPDGRDLVAMDSRRRVFGGMLRRMLVLRDDVCTTPWCEAPIVHADHARPVREHAETSYEEGNGKCTRCNYGKEAPGWRTRVILAGATHAQPTPDSHSDSDSDSDHDSESDHDSGRRDGELGDRASDEHGENPRGERIAGDRAGEDASRARRVVRVTTPLGHTYDAEPPPLLGWGSQTFPVANAPRTKPGMLPGASPGMPPGARGLPPGTSPGRPPATGHDAPVVPSATKAPQVRRATVRSTGADVRYSATRQERTGSAACRRGVGRAQTCGAAQAGVAACANGQRHSRRPADHDRHDDHG